MAYVCPALPSASRRTSTTRPTQPLLLPVCHVSYAAAETDACAFETEEDGRYCANGYVAFYGGCKGEYQANLTVTSTKQKRRKTVTTEKDWSPATDATAPFTLVLISRPFAEDESAAANCASLAYQTYFTTSRDSTDIDNQILWKNLEIGLYSGDTGFALHLFYGSDIPW